MKRSSLVLFLSSILIVQLACSLVPSNYATPDTFATLNGLYTASVQTLEAAGTQNGYTATPGLPLPTGTGGINIPTGTFVVASPIPVSRCDAAAFIDDITYPDGSFVQRGNTFVKVWRIENVGTCTWTSSYSLVFTSGDVMAAPSAIALSGYVRPGEVVDLAVTLTAPSRDGNYRGYWELQNASGTRFGIGAQADTAFWVDVRVIGPSYVAYDFAANYCKANWENGASSLPCPGTQGAAKGFVLKLASPVMENGATENEPGLLTVPQDVRNGYISGQYPAFTVQAGDHFRSIINCQYQSVKCDVIFRLDYRNNGKIQTLASWHEVYEGQYYPIDLDLSSLAGETLKFILVVSANGGQNQDNAIWLDPHIIRQGILPTPTLTPTFTPTSTPTLTPTFTPTSTPTLTPTPTDTPIP